MPVFGMKEENSAFLAVVEEGEALSVLHALPAGKTSSYHTTYAGFTVCAQDTMDLSSVTSVPTAVSVYQKNPFQNIVDGSLLFSRRRRC